MKILAIDFSSPQRSAAAWDGVRLGEVLQTGANATFAFSLIESALRETRLEREQIECLTVGLGPGSYTGIRASVAVAQGWQLARPVKLLGLSSAHVIAAQAQADGLVGRASVVIDAQRGEFYLALYQLDSRGWKELEPLRITAAAEIRQCQACGATVIGPEVGKWFAGGQVVFPRAATLARLAAGRADFVSGENLEPIYLRQPAFVKAPPPRVLPTA